MSDKEGLVAIGGDLAPPRLLEAYAHGIFPWYESGQPLLWWSPDPRLILIPQEFKVSRSLRQALKKPFTFKIDTAFSEVIHNCAANNERLNNTWITEEMIEAYSILHSRGYAHSFEVWLNDKLVGGLYGISLGHAFFGESMFHIVTDASKLAMYYLCQTISGWGFDFIDCQLPTAHLQSLGAKAISRHDFLGRLEESLQYATRLGIWRE